MKYVDELRDPERLQSRLDDLRRLGTQRWTIMDVCGGQTHNLLRHGIEPALADHLDLIHGPGCPVCVTPAEVIDDAIRLAHEPNIILTTFGDMLRVPGRTGSLLQARSHGADVRTVYCPSDAVQLARREPLRQVVFLAVGFETTVPSTALAVLQAEQLGQSNFSVLVHHVRVVPAMRALLEDPSCRIQGFLAAGHVCTVTGYKELLSLATDRRVPIVVTGFEPLDLVEGLIGCVAQLERGRSEVENRYPRCVRLQGNPVAQRLIYRVFAIHDLPWRGFGILPKGGFVLRDKYQQFDARKRFDLPSIHLEKVDVTEQYCAAVLVGRIKSPECPLFGITCTPDAPQGAPMVSSEGACAAYFRYAQQTKESHV
jgi:hydrogenase expression/formation protein HypD